MSKIHGMRKSPEYKAWAEMKQRCLNPRSSKYKHYGARGIGVCSEWLNDFSAFYEHVGQRPSTKHSLDRIDNDGSYVPGNVRWATQRQQVGNQTNTPMLTVDGETASISEWAERSGIKYATLWARYKSGRLTPNQMIAVPVHPQGHTVRRTLESTKRAEMTLR